jgi:hypothetical protein
MNATELLPNGVQSLERLSKEWNGKTTERLVFVEGSGNMFGGSGSLSHIIVHGENSVKETGLVEIRGHVKYNYNIGRGANGPTQSTATYYPVKDGKVLDLFEKKAHIHGACNADDALATVLGLEKDWVIK